MIACRLSSRFTLYPICWAEHYRTKLDHKITKKSTAKM
ncbi:hypothetical protein BRUCa_2998 [Brucella melitensis]|nr:hypothetical protein BM28_B0834 [Brucella melitensis M28]ADZ88948.1 hypothetical protein BM590_B0831 [Brucella melitensis M5-90]AEW16295.1 hypothetical protein BCA52141_II1818 [Brucella canis HSK A52141]AEW19062.1 hypothetical protein BAA13334_II00816 [Brucella abortus A13334]